ncbi:DUF5682 family protein [Asaia prunellae]|uniref:DUF5682 family protein n=1 Tax=Asaia prunellae TaxID=610245 RepID=UPI000687EC0E|nr:DUF5682 family protein [Asaia prunellae]
MVEHTPSGPEMFEAVENAMTALRDAAEQESFLGNTRQRRDQIREAFMRIALRQALKDTDGEIAVIVGAWHVPALRRKTSQTADRTLIRDLKKVRTETAWVPWSDSRLAAGSGYGAGVKAPGWYRHLWSLRGAAGASSAEDFTARWMARVSGFLRTEKLVASPASTIEAARLALTLAALRNKPLPDLEEMRDATLSALCHGDTAPLDLIESRLLKGEQIGALDPEVPQIPLARDLERWQKKCRLKPDDLLRDIALDLRTEAGLLRSTLLHRLSVIDIPWATLLDGAAGRGTYRETWRLTWSPSVALALVQALPYGATIEQAARNKAIQEARQSHDVGRLAALVQKCLLAGLEDAAEQTITRLQHVAVTSQAISPLMESVTTLVSLLRYGTSRPLPIDPLRALVSLLCVEICTGFVMATTDIDPQGARPISTTMAAFDHALTLFGETHLTGLWNQTLAEATRNDRVAPLIGGLALRLLHERQILPVEQVVTCFSRATLPPSRAVSAGQYIDGFLSGGAEIIAQDRALLDALDHWIGVLDEADFMEILPMLRRCFSAFALSSRKRLLTSLEQTPDTEPAQRHSEQGSRQDVLPAEFTDLALPLLHRILGFVS